VSSDECYDCQPFDWLGEEITKWAEQVGADWVKIESARMGWRGVSGYAVTRADDESIIKKLSLNGEWRLDFIFNGEELGVTRYSHDEPVGAYFTINKAQVCRECEDIKVADEAGPCTECADELCGACCEFAR